MEDRLISMSTASEEVIFLRGLNYAPGDCDELQNTLGAKMWIPDIPLYDGQLVSGCDRRAEEERLAHEIAHVIVARKCKKMIAHSRGCFMALLAARFASNHRHHVSSIVMIPSAGDPANVPVNENADSLEDAVLHPLCHTMEQETYKLLKQRHAPTLKKTLKVMNPKKYGISIEDIRSQVLALHSDIPLLFIDCAHDPFRDLDRLNAMIGNRPNTVISHPLPCGHFPHVECPDLLVRTIEIMRREGEQSAACNDPFLHPTEAIVRKYVANMQKA